MKDLSSFSVAPRIAGMEKAGLPGEESGISAGCLFFILIPG
jgi:hypothetical protein